MILGEDINILLDLKPTGDRNAKEPDKGKWLGSNFILLKRGANAKFYLEQMF